jgi:hypothetical protein
MLWHRIGWTTLTLLVLPVSHSQETAGFNLDQHVNQAIDTWSSSHKTVVTTDARRELVLDAHNAVGETTRQHPEFSSTDIAKVVPAAMITFLSDTQNNTTAATLPQLVQERITGFGQVLPQPSEYPTLSVSVTPPKPPDFVVSINGVSYQAGSSLFRLKAGLTQVRVARAAHSCERSITITQTGPNVVTCQL